MPQLPLDSVLTTFCPLERKGSFEIGCIIAHLKLVIYQNQLKTSWLRLPGNLHGLESVMELSGEKVWDGPEQSLQNRILGVPQTLKDAAIFCESEEDAGSSTINGQWICVKLALKIYLENSEPQFIMFLCSKRSAQHEQSILFYVFVVPALRARHYFQRETRTRIELGTKLTTTQHTLRQFLCRSLSEVFLLQKYHIPLIGSDVKF